MVGRDCPSVVGVRVGRDHRDTQIEQRPQVLPNEGCAVSPADHVGQSDELVDAPRPGGQMVEGVTVPSMDGVILHVGEGLMPERDDPSVHAWVGDILVGVRVFVVPPGAHMGFPLPAAQ